MNYKRSILMIKQTHGATPTSDMDIGASQSLLLCGVGYVPFSLSENCYWN